MVAVAGFADGSPVAVYRVSLGKNGVTSNGILSRAEVMATGCAFSISVLLSHGFSLTRPPSGSAAIWSSLFQSSGARCWPVGHSDYLSIFGNVVAEVRLEKSGQFGARA